MKAENLPLNIEIAARRDRAYASRFLEVIRQPSTSKEPIDSVLNRAAGSFFLSYPNFELFKDEDYVGRPGQTRYTMD